MVGKLEERLPGPRYGRFGGAYAPETLVASLAEAEAAFREAWKDDAFRNELDGLLATWAGRPTPLTRARRLEERLGVGHKGRIYLKREDLLHTGAHKINNALGQCLLAKRMGKTRVVAETGAGQHGVATATAAAYLGLACRIYMGTEDMRRQRLNVIRMRLLGAEVTGVESGSRTLKDAINEAFRDWVASSRTTHYCFGSALGPHPFPMIVRTFQEVIGREARAQILEAEKRLPDLIVACVGGGSNAIGIFSVFLEEKSVELLGVEAGGRGDKPGEHASRFLGGRLGVLHGSETLLLQDEDGNVLPTHSVSAGLDYAALGPEHANLAETGRAAYTRVSDDDALAAFRTLSEAEGIIPALESAHAVAEVIRRGRALAGKVVLVNLSGRGDKDVEEAARLLGVKGE